MADKIVDLDLQDLPATMTALFNGFAGGLDALGSGFSQVLGGGDYRVLWQRQGSGCWADAGGDHRFRSGNRLHVQGHAGPLLVPYC
ncbi:MAG: hypothetical protein WB611_02910 [Stellaceae bacterium]